MAKLVWRVKLIAELGSGVVSETEVARIERDDFAVAETVGLTLDEGKRLTAAKQVEIVRAQVATMGERFRWCEHCGAKLLSKGYYPATFRSVFGDVGVRIRRLYACSCRAGLQEPKSFAALLVTGGIAPELAYVTAKFAALAPFARVATLLSDLLPIGGAVNAGTVRNRAVRVGATVAKLTTTGTQMLRPDAATPAVIVGLDGGYVRSRHRRPERNFEVIAGKVIDLDGTQHRFAFARNGGSASSSPAPWCGRVCLAIRRPPCCRTVMQLRNLQRCVLPEATVVLDWFHVAMRFEHVLKAASGLGAGTVDANLGKSRRHDIEHAKWRLWHGRWKGCLVKLADVYRWTKAKSVRNVAGVRTLQRHLQDLLAYLEANRSALVNYDITAAGNRFQLPSSKVLLTKSSRAG